MVAWRSAFVICLAFSSATLVQRGSGDFGNDFSVEDALKETSSVKQRWDRVTTTTKRPATTKAPAKPAGADLDLADALDDRNDPNDGRRKPSAGGGGFSDKDLEDIAWGGGYKPDKGKGDDPYGSNDDPASGGFESQGFCWKPRGDIVLASPTFPSVGSREPRGRQRRAAVIYRN